MKNRFETCTVTLTPLSPIHISGGNSDYGWGAVWIEVQEKMYILEPERFSQKLIESNLFEEYIEKVEEWINYSDSEKEEQSNPCFKFLKDHKQQLFPNIDIQEFVKDLSMTELDAPNGSRFIRNGDGNSYIPGSSIKGAIRTAIIYAMLAENKKREEKDYLNDDYLKNILDKEPDIPNDANSGFDIRKKMDEELIKLVLEDFELTEKDYLGNPITLNRPKPDKGSITNLMRAILVSDSTPIPYVQKNLVDEEVKIIMLDNAIQEDGEIYRDIKNPIDLKKQKGIKQCLFPRENLTVSFKVTIDHEILNSFYRTKSTPKFLVPFRNIKDIRNVINNFFTAVWEAEKNYFINILTCSEIYHEKMIDGVLDFYYRENNIIPHLFPNVNIGLGSGILCKTLFIAIKEEYRIKIRNLQMTKSQIDNQKCGKNKRGNVVDWINKIAPNSRHLVFRNSGRYLNAYRPLGWANLSFGPITYEDSIL